MIELMIKFLQLIKLNVGMEEYVSTLVSLVSAIP